jgi:predicted transcriptional regulator
VTAQSAATRITKLENELATTVWLLAEVTHKHNQLSAMLALAMLQEAQKQQVAQFLAGANTGG